MPVTSHESLLATFSKPNLPYMVLIDECLRLSGLKPHEISYSLKPDANRPIIYIYKKGLYWPDWEAFEILVSGINDMQLQKYRGTMPDSEIPLIAGVRDAKKIREDGY